MNMIRIVNSPANVGIPFVLGSAHVLIANPVDFGIGFGHFKLVFSLLPKKVQ